MLIIKKTVKKCTQQVLTQDEKGGSRKQSKSYVRGLSLIQKGILRVLVFTKLFILS